MHKKGHIRFKVDGYYIFVVTTLLSSHDNLQSDYTTKYYPALQNGFPGKLVTSFRCTTSVQVSGTAD